MSDYTPTTDDMRTSWHRNSMSYGPGERAAEFDRFIAKVKADALREAANALPKPAGLNCNTECHNVDWASLRARADRIESGDGQ